VSFAVRPQSLLSKYKINFKEKTAMQKIKIFISHNSQDINLVSALVDLLRSSLNIPSNDIRCTSLDGYRLPAGISVSDQIKTEIYESKAFIALLTPNSIKSEYVSFELGARWGANLPLFPIFAGGAKVEDVNNWLSNINALFCDTESQVIQLVNDIGRYLGCNIENASSYLALVKKLVYSSNETSSEYIEWFGQLDKKVQNVFQVQMKTEDEEIGQEYSDFFNIANKYYVDFYRPRNGNIDFPEKLEGLIRAAGSPQHIIGIELVSWPSLYEDSLNQDQRRIWGFVKQIYPARNVECTKDIFEYSSIQPKDEAKRFHDARRALSKYWDKWPSVVGFNFIRERYMTRREIVIFLAWLELALVQWTRMGGSHKQDLFKLALRFDKFR
jgi:hypothetical protein